jgi:hypothetical protein
VFDTAAADVSAITAVFNADYTHSSITPSDGMTSSGRRRTHRRSFSP